MITINRVRKLTCAKSNGFVYVSAASYSKLCELVVTLISIHCIHRLELTLDDDML